MSFLRSPRLARRPRSSAAGAVPGGSICGLAAARPRRRPPRSGIRQKGIGDVGQQAAPAGRSVAGRKYLADKYDLPSYPKDLKKRAKINEVMDFLKSSSAHCREPSDVQACFLIVGAIGLAIAEPCL